VRIGSEDYQVDFYSMADILKIMCKYTGEKTNNVDIDIAFQIYVPFHFNLDLRSGGGDIKIVNMKGHFKGGIGGGDIVLNRLAGTVEMGTGGGNIYVHDSHLNGRVSTGGGRVEIKGNEGDLRGFSGGGPVVYENAGEPLRMKASGDDLFVDSAPQGAVLETAGGDIVVKSARKFVRAGTAGGNIQLDSVDGYIVASTASGSVQGTIVADADTEADHHCEIGAIDGDVILKVPKDLPMTFDLRLAFTKGNAGRYTIHSDFPLQITSTNEWDYSSGAPRKYIYGTGSTGDGKNLIKIRVLDGNIYLRTR